MLLNVLSAVDNVRRSPTKYVSCAAWLFGAGLGMLCAQSSQFAAKRAGCHEETEGLAAALLLESTGLIRLLAQIWLGQTTQDEGEGQEIVEPQPAKVDLSSLR